MRYALLSQVIIYQVHSWMYLCWQRAATENFTYLTSLRVVVVVVAWPHTAAFLPVTDPGWHPHRLMNICCALWRIKKYVFGNNSHRIYERIYAWQRKMFGANAHHAWMKDKKHDGREEMRPADMNVKRRVAQGGVRRCEEAIVRACTNVTYLYWNKSTE